MSKPNLEAKKERHRKLYEGQYHSFIGRIWYHFKRALRGTWHRLKPKKKLSHYMHPLDHMPAPKRLYTQVAIWSICLLLITSMNVTSAAYTGGEGVGAEYLALETTGTVISDDEGYILKPVPSGGEAVYDLNRIDNVIHEVQSGETLSVIAYRYGLSINSIRYSNSSVGYSDNLRVGQELTIPPKDGLFVDIGSGDSLVALVDEYDGNVDETRAFNGIGEGDELIAGEELFVVGGRPEVIVVAAPTYTAGSYSTPAVLQYNDLPVSAEGWIRPTQGIITQGYRGGHLAYDIADRSKPPVLAAASGTIIKADSGGWGGGYGNHIIIDHGNGYQTLYAHNDVNYVNVGDYVNQGQVIAKMGKTGRVYGVTGIHLHFEISLNGVKISPSNMGVW